MNERHLKRVNYNHQYYFWMVARNGGVARAAEELMVSHPTVGNQCMGLETALGHRHCSTTNALYLSPVTRGEWVCESRSRATPWAPSPSPSGSGGEMLTFRQRFRQIRSK
jgi:hypothetical protein